MAQTWHSYFYPETSSMQNVIFPLFLSITAPPPFFSFFGSLKNYIYLNGEWMTIEWCSNRNGYIELAVLVLAKIRSQKMLIMEKMVVRWNAISGNRWRRVHTWMSHLLPAQFVDSSSSFFWLNDVRNFPCTSINQRLDESTCVLCMFVVCKRMM